MSPKETAYIVERLAVRFMAMVADYERKLVEHRDSFGARTSADAKIIEGLRRELFMLTGLNDKLIVDREEAWKERDGLLTQVQDMRAEMERLRAEVAFLKIRDREYEKALDLCDKEEQTPAECIAALQERLRASIARGDFAQMEVAALKSQTPKHPVKVGEWVECVLTDACDQSHPLYRIGTKGRVGRIVERPNHIWEYHVTIGGSNQVWWESSYCIPCDPPQTEPVPKREHPVAVGGYLRRLIGFNTTPAGEVARVTLVDGDDASQLEYEVVRPNGEKGRWSAKGCEPCDPPEATAKLTPKIGDTVRLVTHPERAQVAEHLRTALQWPWISRWGLVGQTGKVVKPLVAVAETVAVALDGSTIFARWPIACLEVVSEATHDTEVGKAAAEAALTTEPVADEIKVWDVVEVYQATGKHTAQNDVGFIGTVGTIHLADRVAHVRSGLGMPHMVDLCDVRKVRKVTT